MYKITIKAKSGKVYPVNFPQERYSEIVDSAYEDTDFTDYFNRKYGSDNGQQSLMDKGVSDGYMRFELIDGEIWTITEYLSPEKLNEEELEILGEYTQGQWSDGIGEGFEQQPLMEYEGEDVYLSPWYRNQKVKFEQEKSNDKISPKKEERELPPLEDISQLLKDAKDLIKNLRDKRGE